MKLDVPYYSQFIDVQDSFWMIRACGAAAFKEVVEFYNVTVPDIVTLCNEGKERGGYDMENGWIHNYLVMKAKELGLTAHRKEGLANLDEIIACLKKGNPVIVSVEKRVLEQKRFHIIVLTGFEAATKDEGAPISNFYYHESESTERDRGMHRTCDAETLEKYWRGKAIFIEKNSA